jgi:hypothetical protein
MSPSLSAHDRISCPNCVAHNLSSDRVPRGLMANDVHIVFLDAQDYLS